MRHRRVHISQVLFLSIYAIGDNLLTEVDELYGHLFRIARPLLLEANAFNHEKIVRYQGALVLLNLFKN